MASQSKTGQAGNGSMYATKALIMAADDLAYEEMVVPEWNDMKVRVRQLTGSERGFFEGAVTKVGGVGDDMSVQMDPTKMRVTLVALTLCDEKGKRIFTDREIDALGTKSSSAIERIYEVSARMSGLTAESVEEASDLSEATQPSDSTSDSASS